MPSEAIRGRRLNVEQALSLMDDQKRALKHSLSVLKKHGLIFLRLDLLATVDGTTLRVTCKGKTTFPSMATLVSSFRAAGIEGDLDYKARLGMTGRQYWCYRVTQQAAADHECVKSITIDEMYSTIYILL